MRRDLIEERRDGPPSQYRGRQADTDPQHDRPHSVSEHHVEDPLDRCAERKVDGDLTASSLDRGGDDAIDVGGCAPAG